VLRNLCNEVEVAQDRLLEKIRLAAVGDMTYCRIRGGQLVVHLKELVNKAVEHLLDVNPFIKLKIEN